jgi:ABC-type multidrug transport system fused ATPase/permease subunit
MSEFIDQAKKVQNLKHKWLINCGLLITKIYFITVYFSTFYLFTFRNLHYFLDHLSILLFLIDFIIYTAITSWKVKKSTKKTCSFLILKYQKTKKCQTSPLKKIIRLVIFIVIKRTFINKIFRSISQRSKKYQKKYRKANKDVLEMVYGMSIIP